MEGHTSKLNSVLLKIIFPLYYLIGNHTNNNYNKYNNYNKVDLYSTFQNLSFKLLSVRRSTTVPVSDVAPW